MSMCLTQTTFGPPREKSCLRGVAYNKGADQPAGLRSLIITFVVPLLKVSYLDLLQVKFQFTS